MLTNNDLSKFGTLIDSKLGLNNTKLEQHFDEKLDAKFDEKLAPIKKSLSKLSADQKVILNALDKDIISVRTRVERVERHLGFAHI